MDNYYVYKIKSYAEDEPEGMLVTPDAFKSKDEAMKLVNNLPSTVKGFHLWALIKGTHGQGSPELLEFGRIE